MFIPYSTDAPIYHLPVATVGLIVVNTVIFFALLTGHIADPEPWILPYGAGLTPAQWVTSMFIHADLGHLIGNMIFLWVFGLVIEGKIGWYRFLMCYLSIGIIQSAGEQSLQLLLGGQGGSLGASSAIYGLLAMAAIWAPKNDITVFYWFFVIVAGTGEIAIMIFALLYIGFDLILSIFLGFNSSSWLHVGGAMVGAPLAILMLKKDMVDCEGWDIFSVWRDEKGDKKKESQEEAAELAKLQEIRDTQILSNAKQQIDQFLANNNYTAAHTLLKKLRHVGNGLELSRQQLLKLVAGLHQEKRWQESCPLMAEVVERFPAQAETVKIKLAQICVVELNRPGKAIDLLKSLDLEQLPPKTLSLVKKIAQRAKQMQAAGEMELDTDDW